MVEIPSSEFSRRLNCEEPEIDELFKEDNEVDDEILITADVMFQCIMLGKAMQWSAKTLNRDVMMPNVLLTTCRALGT